jgi:hypothetical protein
MFCKQSAGSQEKFILRFGLFHHIALFLARATLIRIAQTTLGDFQRFFQLQLQPESIAKAMIVVAHHSGKDRRKLAALQEACREKWSPIPPDLPPQLFSAQRGDC